MVTIQIQKEICIGGQGEGQLAHAKEFKAHIVLWPPYFGAVFEFYLKKIETNYKLLIRPFHSVICLLRCRYYAV